MAILRSGVSPRLQSPSLNAANELGALSYGECPPKLRT